MTCRFEIPIVRAAVIAFRSPGTGVPPLAEERVVLGRVHERVHAARAEELDDVEALLVAPGVAVEALDDAPDPER